ncbi:MAG: AAA family ATPase [candidate division WOR-3 bacterium]|nr:AAA family ATPase [candidate division WOR-3 bacterium]
MRLKEIVLSGFKSFPKKTCIKLREGITTFVGPNGCGKSNIIDAIKWGLGETSTKRLRADYMEDLIFSGTENRSSVGMAEVTLLFENNGGIPIDYDEVEVKRRFFRSGEAEFLINNTHCRLRDIQSLFANTGLKSAILDQGIVEDFLIADSDLRREIFESVAGIKKYKVDRREAWNKLNSVSRALEKIEIILKEKKKVLRSLKREANRAKRFHHLQNELKEGSILSAKSRLFLLERELEEGRKLIKTLDRKLDKIFSNIRKSETEIKLGEEEIKEKRKESRKNEEKLQELQDEISKHREEKALSEGELKRIGNFIHGLPSNIKDSINQLEEKKRELRDKEEKINSKAPEYEEEMKKIEQEFLNLSSEIEFLKERELSLKIKTQEQSSRVFSLEENLKERGEDLESEKKRLEELNSKIVEIGKELKENAGEINKLTIEIENGDSKKASLLRELQNGRTEYGRIKKEIDFYQSREIELSEGMKLIRDKIGLPLLSNNIEVKKGYEAAVEAIFGEFLKSVVGGIDEIKEAIKILKKESAKGGLFILDNEDNEKGEGEMKEVVSGKYSHLLKKELSKYHVARDLSQALGELAENRGFWVTPNGDIINDKFIALSQDKEGILVRRAKERELLKEEERQKEELKKLELEKDRIINYVNKLRNKLTGVEKRREVLANKKSSIEFDISRIDYEIQSIKDDLSSDTREINELNESILKKNEERKETGKKRESLQAKISQLETNKRKIEEEISKIQRRREALRNRENTNREALSRLREGLRLSREKEELGRGIERLKGEIEKETRKFISLKEKNRELYKGIQKKEEIIDKKKKEYSNQEEDKDNIEKEISELKMKVFEKEYEGKNFTNEIYKEFGVEIQGEDVETEPNLDERLKELREKIESLKPINPLATSQYQEKKSELDELTEEQVDLLQSKKDIENSIREIDKKAKKEFQEIIADIRKDFQLIYDKLIVGGKADIKLSEDNILESDIEVWVQPKGKTLKRMELFSTGEKTLAAIALLLAIMRKRQSPIYIMDEIDAPLDENNIERFINILQEFSESAQILIVTHNRKTMEAANSIYGVTMEEEGISTALSIDINDI